MTSIFTSLSINKCSNVHTFEEREVTRYFSSSISSILVLNIVVMTFFAEKRFSFLSNIKLWHACSLGWLPTQVHQNKSTVFYKRECLINKSQYPYRRAVKCGMIECIFVFALFYIYRQSIWFCRGKSCFRDPGHTENCKSRLLKQR